MMIRLRTNTLTQVLGVLLAVGSGFDIALAAGSAQVEGTQSRPQSPAESPDKAGETIAAGDATEPAKKPGEVKADEAASAKDGNKLNTGLDTFYLRDADGELVPVLNMPLEEFQRLHQLDRNLPQPERPPQFSVERIEIDGNVTGQRARLEMTLTIKQLVDGIVRVPLRLTDAILSRPPEYEGGGSHVLDAASAKGGYVSWLRGPADSEHRIKLAMVVPVSVVGRESRLSLSLPRAASAELRLEVPGKNAASVNSEAEVLSRKVLESNRTEYRVVGVGGEFQMVWGAARRRANASPLLLEAAGDIHVEVKGPGTVSTTARFRLTSFGRPMSTVRIKLPTDAKPLSVEDSRYTVEFISPPRDDADKKDMAPIAVVRFREPTHGPIDVQLAVEQTAATQNEAATRENSVMDVLGFEVVSAVRHFGTVALMADSDWLVRWDEGGDLRRVSDVPDPLPPGNVIAVFEYYRQPAALPIRINAKETRVNLDPIYILDVQSNQVEIKALLNLRVRGAPASFVQLDLAGWEDADISDLSLVREDGLRLSELTPLEIPLESPRRGDFQLRVSARQMIPEGLETLRLKLPTVHGAATSPAVVIVIPDDNLVLSGNAEGMGAFDPEPLPESLVLPARERPPLCYRYRGDPQTAILEYNFGKKEQLVSTSVENRVSVSQTSATVDQVVTYRIRYEPLDRLRLRIPKGAAEARQMRFLLDNEEIDLSSLAPKPATPAAPTESEQDSQAEPPPDDAQANEEAAVEDEPDQPDSVVGVDQDNAFIVWSVPLPQPRLGEVVLETRYSVPDDRLLGGSQVAHWEIPLVVPLDVEFESVTLQADVPASFSVAVEDADNWTPEKLTAGEAPAAAIRMTASTQPDRVPIEVRQVRSQRGQRIVVERAFAQTWLSPTQRQDRATFLLSMVTSPIRIQLPIGAVPDKTVALVNGRRVTLRPDSENNFCIDLPEATLEQVQLELKYPFTERPRRGAMQMELPDIDGAGWARNLFWQLVTPADEHLIAKPVEFSAENSWTWLGIGFRRVPRFSQAALEDWSGATSQQAPSFGSNVYLFSGFGDRRPLSPRTAGRRLLLLCGSGLVLILMLAAFVLPTELRRWAALGLLILLCVAGWLNPSLTLLACQAAALGIALVGLSRILRWLLADRMTHFSDLSMATIAASQSGVGSVGSSSQPRSSSTDALQVSVSATER